MIRDQANHLADKLAHIWPRGAITLDVWAEVLEELHYGPAELALRKLRDTIDTMPSIATFRHAYAAELGTHTERIDCPKCGGDGWNTIGEGGRDMTPCNCRAGSDAQTVHRRIIEGNGSEFRRLGRTAHVNAVPPPSPDYRNWADQP